MSYNFIMRTYIHVNQHIIKSNKKNEASEPPITVKNYQENRKANVVEILDNEGQVIAKVLYKPDDPLACGASVWIETKNKVICY